MEVFGCYLSAATSSCQITQKEPATKISLVGHAPLDVTVFEMEQVGHHPIPYSGDDQRELHLSSVRLWGGLKSAILSTPCAANASKYSKNDA